MKYCQFWRFMSTYFQKNFYYGRPWPAVYINFILKTHQIQVLTEPLCRAQAIFMRCWTTSTGWPTARSKPVEEICRATYSASQTRLRFNFHLTVSITIVRPIETPQTTPNFHQTQITTVYTSNIIYCAIFRILTAFSGVGALGPALALCKNTYSDRA